MNNKTYLPNIDYVVSNRNRYIVINDLKTAKSYRYVYIPETTIVRLVTLIEKNSVTAKLLRSNFKKVHSNMIVFSVPSSAISSNLNFPIAYLEGIISFDD